MMGKVFVFLADGFEEIEGLTVVDMLRRAEIPTVTVSIGSSRNIIGAHRIEVEADIMFLSLIHIYWQKAYLITSRISCESI